MLHHVSIGSNDIARSRALYDPVMVILGLRVLAEDETSVDYGASDIIFSVETPVDGRPATTGNGVHIAFQARDRAAVQAFTASGWAMAQVMTGYPAYALSTTRTTTAPFCAIPTETRSKR